MDLYDKLTTDRTPLRMLTVEEGPLYDPLFKKAGEYFLFPELSGPIANRMYFNGAEKIVWSLNNYLGLANVTSLREKEVDACQKWGVAYPMGARMFSGENYLLRQLEQKLSEFTDKASTVIFNYGYQGIFSLIDALVDLKDVILYDAQSHACIVDGVRLHSGKRFSFLHNDMDNLALILERAAKITARTGGGILVITEGVFGMSGDQGKLREIVDLKRQYDFRLLVDDAHGFGVMGQNGVGTAAAQGVQDGVDLYFATFAKSIASIGAFVSGDTKAIDFVRYGIRSQMFAKTLPLLFVESNLARLEYMFDHPELREKLWSNALKLQQGLREMGFNLGNTDSQVTPVFLNCSVREGANMMIDLRENYHIFCSGALFPVVPRDVFLLRLIPTAIHTDEDINQTLSAFQSVKTKLDRGAYRGNLDPSTLEKYLCNSLQNG